jgi:hypothetical protein
VSTLWVHELADRFWDAAGGVPAQFPYDLDYLAGCALPLAIHALPGLSVTRVDAWLAERNLELLLAIRDRPLRACIILQDGDALLFVDADDPDDERRFSLAHEIAHYLVEFSEPRAVARARLGTDLAAVLNGQRLPTGDERFGALLAGVALAPCLHLMERTAEGHLPGQRVSDAEQAADALAFELLAPVDIVRSHLGPTPARADVIALLRDEFRLPSGPATSYARSLAPEPPPGSLFRRLFSVP